MTLYEELCWRQSMLWMEQAYKCETKEGASHAVVEAVMALLEACFS